MPIGSEVQPVCSSRLLYEACCAREWRDAAGENQDASMGAAIDVLDVVYQILHLAERERLFSRNVNCARAYLNATHVSSSMIEAASKGPVKDIITDGKGSVIATGDADGLHARGYAPYGYAPTSDSIQSALGYNGEYTDPVTGSYHLGNGYRAFSPALMRFTAPDSASPFGRGGLNTYVYCSGNPINAIDPGGHAPWFVWMVLGVGLGGASFGTGFDIEEAVLAWRGIQKFEQIAEDEGAGSELASNYLKAARLNRRRFVFHGVMTVKDVGVVALSAAVMSTRNNSESTWIGIGQMAAAIVGSIVTSGAKIGFGVSIRPYTVFEARQSSELESSVPPLPQYADVVGDNPRVATYRMSELLRRNDTPSNDAQMAPGDAPASGSANEAHPEVEASSSANVRSNIAGVAPATASERLSEGAQAALPGSAQRRSSLGWSYGGLSHTALVARRSIVSDPGAYDLAQGPRAMRL